MFTRPRGYNYLKRNLHTVAQRALCDSEGGECWHVRPPHALCNSTKRAWGANTSVTLYHPPACTWIRSFGRIVALVRKKGATRQRGLKLIQVASQGWDMRGRWVVMQVRFARLAVQVRLGVRVRLAVHRSGWQRRIGRQSRTLGSGSKIGAGWAGSTTQTGSAG